MKTQSDETPNRGKSPVVDVAAALIVQSAGSTRQFLVARRKADQHQGGLYEFVGGKVEEGEQVADALAREVFEEVGLCINTAVPLTTIEHDYGDKRVRLHVFYVDDFTGEATGKEGQVVKWVDLPTMLGLPMPKANNTIKRLTMLSPLYAITQEVSAFGSSLKPEQAWLNFYTERLPHGAQVYVRCRHMPKRAYGKLLANLHQRRGDLKLVADFAYADTLNFEHVAGFHLTQAVLMGLKNLPKLSDKYYIAATHDAASLKQAARLVVDAATLSPIQRTTSHPEVLPLSDEQQKALLACANFPVYALGGMAPNQLGLTQEKGFFGVAGISHFV